MHAITKEIITNHKKISLSETLEEIGVTGKSKGYRQSHMRIFLRIVIAHQPKLLEVLLLSYFVT